MVADDNRITLAVLKRDLEHLTATVEILRGDIASWQQDQELRLRHVEDWSASSRVRWDTHGEEHDELRSKNLLADALNAIGAIIAAIVGVFVRPQ